MSRGRAYPILKRTSHIMLTVTEINPKKETKKGEKIPNPEVVKTVKPVAKKRTTSKKTVK
jgi:hypothetical protein